MALPQTDLRLLRNIGIIAHIDAGKTTTSEHLLYYSGAKHKLGGVDEGTTETDYDPEEQERGITIYSACIPLPWRGHTINLIDTPGHVDFTAEVERSLRVLDGCVCVFDAQKGVEAQSETVWRQADKYSVPRLVFVNKMDVVGANFANVLAEITERLEGKPLPVVIPIGSGSSKDSATPFCGVIDLIEQQALYFEPSDYGRTVRTAPIPDDMLDEVKAYREQLFDVLTQHDEQDLITTAYLEGRTIAVESIRQLVREQTIKRLIQPVLAGSGREHIGIQPLLDAICWYLPSPLDRPPVVGQHPSKPDKQEKRKPDAKEPLCALVFKIVAATTGDLFYVRIYSGTLKANSRVFNPGKNVKELVQKVFHVHADPKAPREELPAAYAGDIVACIGLKDSVTGDTLCDTQHPLLLESIQFAESVVSQSIEPESSADKDRLLELLNNLSREDPTFVWRHDKETGQTLMSGMGTLHLEIKVHKLERDYRMKVRVGKPRVSYRETLREPITVEGECNRVAGTPLFAKLTVQFTNNQSESAVSVTSKLKPNTLTPQLQAAAERGLKGMLQTGELGYPLMHVQAVIVDAVMDPALSNEIAFEIAAADAVRKALRDNIVLLEPIMRLEVQVPEEYLGTVLTDLQSRRAILEEEIIMRGKWRVVPALVPLARMFDYTDKVRSLTQGRASPSMEPHSYAPAPDEVLRAMTDPDAVTSF